jgi:flagellar protein FlgJ
MAATPPLHSLLVQSAGELAADSRSLDGLKRAAARDPRGAARQAAQQFEALFMQTVLKSMREATLKSGLLDSSAQQTIAGMLDQQLAGRIAAGGTGLADVIARQLELHVGRTRASGLGSPSPGAAEHADPGQRVPAERRLPVVAAAADRYAELARRGSTAGSRYEALAQTAPGDAVRAAYLARGLARADAAPGSSAPDAQRARFDDSSARRNFATRHLDHALAAQHATGIPARFILGQAALESGWGAHEIRGADGTRSYNLFGIKATGGWQGRTIEVVTTEYEAGRPRQVVEKFRAYSNYSEAFRDWAQLLSGNPRYAPVLRAGDDAMGFAFGLQRAGYATDPDYGAKLARVIGSLRGLDL